LRWFFAIGDTIAKIVKIVKEKKDKFYTYIKKVKFINRA
jgi:hypothetical protein